jgi:hypothetical protein
MLMKCDIWDLIKFHPSWLLSLFYVRWLRDEANSYILPWKWDILLTLVIVYIGLDINQIVSSSNPPCANKLYSRVNEKKASPNKLQQQVFQRFLELLMVKNNILKV